MSIRISVALCTYNGDKFLTPQLESIAAQSMPIDELIVFDDGSKDRSIEIVTQFKKNAPFPVILHQNSENQGSSKNFENCIKACSGEYIFLCDQDDIWRQDKVKKQIEYFEQNPGMDAHFSNAEMINQASESTGIQSFDKIEFIPSTREAWKSGKSFDILLRGYVVTGATLAIRSSIIQHVFPVPHLWKELIHDGWIALYLSIFNKISFSDEPLIQYREHASQQVGFGKKSMKLSIWERFSRDREIKLTKLNRKYKESEKLYNYLKNLQEIPEATLEKVENRFKHYKMRSELPSNRLSRLYPIIKFCLNGSYKRNENGDWIKPVLGDLME